MNTKPASHQYRVYKEWIGEYDDCPNCKFNKRVGCPKEGRSCKDCGFNPVVSARRLIRKYGKKNLEYLSVEIER